MFRGSKAVLICVSWCTLRLSSAGQLHLVPSVNLRINSTVARLYESKSNNDCASFKRLSPFSTARFSVAILITTVTGCR
jgi:hypothetical protein